MPLRPVPLAAGKLLHPRGKHAGVVRRFIRVLAGQTRSPAGQARWGRTRVKRRGRCTGTGQNVLLRSRGGIAKNSHHFLRQSLATQTAALMLQSQNTSSAIASSGIGRLCGLFVSTRRGTAILAVFRRGLEARDTKTPAQELRQPGIDHDANREDTVDGGHVQ